MSGFFVATCAVLLVVVFAWASVAKLVSFGRWRNAIGRYHLGVLAGPLAVAVPLAEAGLVALLLLAPLRLAGASTVGALAAFSAALLRGRAIHGDRLPCGCFGGSEERDFRGLLARNVGLGVLAALVALGATDESLVSKIGAPDFGEILPAVLAAAGVGVGAWLLYESAAQLGRRRR